MDGALGPCAAQSQLPPARIVATRVADGERAGQLRSRRLIEWVVAVHVDRQCRRKRLRDLVGVVSHPDGQGILTDDGPVARHLDILHGARHGRYQRAVEGQQRHRRRVTGAFAAQLDLRVGLHEQRVQAFDDVGHVFRASDANRAVGTEIACKRIGLDALWHIVRQGRVQGTSRRGLRDYCAVCRLRPGGTRGDQQGSEDAVCEPPRKRVASRWVRHHCVQKSTLARTTTCRGSPMATAGEPSPLFDVKVVLSNRFFTFNCRFTR